MSNKGRIHYNKDDSLKRYRCYYCDRPALEKDHRPPMSCSWLHPKKDRWLVRCCASCNVILGNKPFNLIQAEAYMLGYFESKCKRSRS